MFLFGLLYLLTKLDLSSDKHCIIWTTLMLLINVCTWKSINLIYEYLRPFWISKTVKNLIMSMGHGWKILYTFIGMKTMASLKLHMTQKGWSVYTELTYSKFVQYDVTLIFTLRFSSIMGHGSEVGIIPRFCEELFSRAYHDQEVTRDSEMVSQTWYISHCISKLSP